jgi:nitroimidazol reductase NimA-like FMN-containing flavoprotein (pyridoxamine 5'-phosphate oxidase superfamily)
MTEAATPRTEVRRLAERGVYDRATVESILDEALICHLGVVHDGSPVVIPTIHARVGDVLFFHGSPASRVLRDMKKGAEVCVAVTLLDGLVVARASFHNSMNYRSVVVYGTPRLVDDPDEKRAALDAITEHVVPGRSTDARPMTAAEVRATMVMALPLDETSAKVRAGGPIDDEDDYDLPIWAGVVPLVTAGGTPVADDRLAEGVPVPPYLERYHR